MNQADCVTFCLAALNLKLMRVEVARFCQGGTMVVAGAMAS